MGEANGSTRDPSVAAPVRDLTQVITALEKARKTQKRLSYAFGVLGAVSALAGVTFLAHQAGVGIEHIVAAAAKDTKTTSSSIAAQTAYLIVRGTGLAAIVGGVVYFILGLARSSLDQATRYEKRLIASYLIDYALHTPDIEVDRLSAAHQIVEVWGSTVESAYTPPRVAKRLGALEFSASKDGAGFKSDPRQP